MSRGRPTISHSLVESSPTPKQRHVSCTGTAALHYLTSWIPALLLHAELVSGSSLFTSALRRSHCHGEPWTSGACVVEKWSSRHMSSFSLVKLVPWLPVAGPSSIAVPISLTYDDGGSLQPQVPLISLYRALSIENPPGRSAYLHVKELAPKAPRSHLFGPCCTERRGFQRALVPSWDI